MTNDRTPEQDIHALMERYWALSKEPTMETKAFLDARAEMVWLDIGIFIGYIMKLERELDALRR
jgi:hypothetical protein